MDWQRNEWMNKQANEWLNWFAEWSSRLFTTKYARIRSSASSTQLNISCVTNSQAPIPRQQTILNWAIQWFCQIHHHCHFLGDGHLPSMTATLSTLLSSWITPTRRKWPTSLALHVSHRSSVYYLPQSRARNARRKYGTTHLSPFVLFLSKAFNDRGEVLQYRYSIVVL